jgi:hypothetical protein
MFKLHWDKPANGVRLTLQSPDDALAVAPRPVFHEELDLLGLPAHGWRYTPSAAPLLWACDRRYFYKGELVMEAAGGNIYDPLTSHKRTTLKNVCLRIFGLTTTRHQSRTAGQFAHQKEGNQWAQ